MQVLTPNEAEARQLTAMAGEGPVVAEAAARALAALGPSLVCVKLDGGGCLALHDGHAWRQHAAPVQAIDSTGAGDAFTGALAVALLEGKSAADAVEYAVVASEIAIGE